MASGECLFLLGYLKAVETGENLEPYFLTLPLLMHAPSHSFCVTLAIVGIVTKFNDAMATLPEQHKLRFALAKTAMSAIHQMEPSACGVARDLAF